MERGIKIYYRLLLLYTQNCLILYSYEAELIQELVREKKIKHSLWPSIQHSGTSTTICQLTIVNYCYLHANVDSVYPSDSFGIEFLKIQSKLYTIVFLLCLKTVTEWIYF